MHTLQVYLFGGVRVTFEGENTDLKLSKGVQNLLVYLLLNRQRMLSRELVAGTLWGEQNQDNARKCLNTTLWRLCQYLSLEDNPGKSFLLTSNAGEIGFNPHSDYWLDLKYFEEAIELIQAKSSFMTSETKTEYLENALSLYRGDLLEGNYEDWAIREREHKRQQYINACQYLMFFYAQQDDFDRGLYFGQRILDQDPLREDIHRAIMHIYQQSGRRSSALQQYEMCRSALAAELGILPMEETQNLYLQILNESNHNLSLTRKTQDVDLQRALVQLRQVTRALSKTQRELNQTLQLIKKDYFDQSE